MIGARLTPHQMHHVAVLVRVLAAVTFIAGLAVVSVALVGAVGQKLPVATALVRVAVAIVLMLSTMFLARRLDPLRD